MGSAQAADNALFGLQWGVFPEDARELNIRLSRTQIKENFTTFTTAELPKNLRDADAYALTFDERDGLVKITMIGQRIERDIFGTKGKERFEELRKLLSKKYKPLPKQSIERVAPPVVIQPGQVPPTTPQAGQFYECLGLGNCGAWIAVFRAENMRIYLELKGINASTGYIQISAEAWPKYGNAVNRLNEALAESDADAF